MKIEGMAERGWPQVTMFMLWPVERSINHDRTAGPDDVLDRRFCPTSHCGDDHQRQCA